MNFRTGYTVKPKEVLTSGQVVFTDGTNDVVPNQASCEAYGYIYDKTSRTCVAFQYSPRLLKNIANENNFVKGNLNQPGRGTNNTMIVGQQNTTQGDNRSNILVGEFNDIAYGVKNSTVLGSYGQAERSGEVVIGGGGFSGSGVGKAQTSTIILTGTTTDATVTALFVSGDASTTIIARDDSATSYQGIEANIIGVRTGGTAAGSVGDRILLNAKGLVLGKVANQSNTTSASSGTVTGWDAGLTFSGTNDMTFSVQGAANMDISWSCTLNIYEIKV